MFTDPTRSEPRPPRNAVVPISLAFLATVAVFAAATFGVGALAPGDLADLMDGGERDGTVFFAESEQAVAEVAAAPELPAMESVRLWSNGDSTSFFMSVELGALITGRGGSLVQPEADYQNGTGLITREYFDWPAYLQSEMAAKDPNLAVFMIGANDAKFIGDPEAYRALVAQAMDLMEAPGRRVVWVGQPNSSQPKLAANVPVINAIFQEEAAKRPWVTFVDTWSATSDADGNYAQDLVDASGRTVRARADDGVHFTQEGGRILAAVVMAAISDLYR